ncbi:MAG: YicC family protein [Desulfamplus sp.]|nr:YicC family protein [Desulfamplus sp.]
MIKSMTAYAAASHMEKDVKCDVEIRSYNSRHLDIALYLPRSFSGYEDAVKKAVAAKVARGRVEVRMDISDHSRDAVTFQVDMTRARAYHRALTDLAREFSIPSQGITLELLLGGREMIISGEGEENVDLIRAPLFKALDTALDELDSMRIREGANLSGDIMARIDHIERSLHIIKRDSSSLPLIYRDRLMERIAALTEGVDGLDPVRISQEAAILADKSDISEEIVRAYSHVALFRETVESPEPGGRKLNFLIQEFNREFNTMGSKSSRAELSHLIVDLKSELEKIREQIQNIE